MAHTCCALFRWSDCVNGDGHIYTMLSTQKSRRTCRSSAPVLYASYVCRLFPSECAPRLHDALVPNSARCDAESMLCTQRAMHAFGARKRHARIKRMDCASISLAAECTHSDAYGIPVSWPIRLRRTRSGRRRRPWCVCVCVFVNQQLCYIHKNMRECRRGVTARR